MPTKRTFYPRGSRKASLAAPLKRTCKILGGPIKSFFLDTQVGATDHPDAGDRAPPSKKKEGGRGGGRKEREGREEGRAERKTMMPPHRGEGDAEQRKEARGGTAKEKERQKVPLESTCMSLLR